MQGQISWLSLSFSCLLFVVCCLLFVVRNTLSPLWRGRIFATFMKVGKYPSLTEMLNMIDKDWAVELALNLTISGEILYMSPLFFPSRLWIIFQISSGVVSFIVNLDLFGFFQIILVFVISVWYFITQFICDIK